MLARLQAAVSSELTYAASEDGPAQLERVDRRFSRNIARSHDMAASPWASALSGFPATPLLEHLRDLRRIAQPAGELFHRLAVTGLLAVLALVAHHLPGAFGPEQRLHIFQLQRNGVGGVLVEVEASRLLLESAQLAAKANVDLLLGSALPDVSRGPSQPGIDEVLLARKRNTGRAAYQHR